MKHCESCGNEHDGTFGSGRYCSRSCSNSRKHTAETKSKIKKSLLKRFRKNKKRVFREDVICVGCKTKFNKLISSKKKYCTEECKCKNQHKGKRKGVSSIFNISSRTRVKVVKRMSEKSGCFNCGWNEDVCDLHHIHGKKIDNPHSHSNLTLLCPNCHRLAHSSKLKKFCTLQEAWGDAWKDLYYG